MTTTRAALGFATVLVLLAASSSLAQPPCAPDEVTARSSADTIFVEHRHAELNCCLVLALDIRVGALTVDFYESDTGEPCDCYCCFDLRYAASGFTPGRWRVRVWDAAGTVLHGETEVEVNGTGGPPQVAWMFSGDCVTVQVDARTWGGIRELYR